MKRLALAMAVAAIVLAAVIVLRYAGPWLRHRPGTPPSARVSATRPAGEVTSPAGWAAAIDRPGLPNLHKVADGLYRGAQPTAEGMRELEKMGVRTVVNLRSFNSDRDELKGTNLAYEHIWMKAWHPEDEEVARFLKIVTDPGKGPVFVHCQHGADRTGMMCAVYRVAVCGWTREQAAREMAEGGFGFHGIWRNLLEYLENLDVEKMKRQAGIAARSPAAR